jgi:hypothetical protein
VKAIQAAVVQRDVPFVAIPELGVGGAALGWTEGGLGLGTELGLMRLKGKPGLGRRWA